MTTFPSHHAPDISITPQYACAKNTTLEVRKFKIYVYAKYCLQHKAPGLSGLVTEMIQATGGK